VAESWGNALLNQRHQVSQMAECQINGPERLLSFLSIALCIMRSPVVKPPPAHHYTVWENIGYSLLTLAAACAILCYWIGFRVEAQCLVIGKTTGKPCENYGKVILGCPRHHRWKKPVAWIRYLGAANRLDPWLLRLHIRPPSFAPIPTPIAQRSPTTTQGAVAPATPDSKMTREARLAVWGLGLAFIQTATGIITLVAAR
jgi:hypothetical protein